jgi:hypothetical protein
VAQHICLTIRPEFSGTVLRTILMAMPILSHFFLLFCFYPAYQIIFGMGTFLSIVCDIHVEMAAVLHME